MVPNTAYADGFYDGTLSVPGIGSGAVGTWTAAGGMWVYFRINDSYTSSDPIQMGSGSINITTGEAVNASECREYGGHVPKLYA